MAKTKEKKHKPIDLDSVITKFHKLAKKAILHPDKPLSYSGPEITLNSILAVDRNIKQSLSPEALEYHSDRDRDSLTVLLIKLYQLGYQDGVYTTQEDLQVNWYRSAVETYQKIVENLTEELKIEREKVKKQDGNSQP